MPTDTNGDHRTGEAADMSDVETSYAKINGSALNEFQPHFEFPF
jgi:hypothetical protein